MEIDQVLSISAIIAAISVVVGVIFAILQMRQATKMRYTGLVIQLNPALRTSINDLIEASKIMDLEFENYEEYSEKYGKPTSDKALVTLAGYYDGLGFLLHKRLIAIDLIEYRNLAITSTWEKLKPIIIGLRKETGLPELFEWFEYLYNEITKRKTNVYLSPNS
ncbi:MAG: hypothetical protein JSW00_18840 [Thermoplasmata archaeon]|nr:MAG: hypothetical protein JSW00_18840 [Thermoplasmata archaeon]